MQWLKTTTRQYRVSAATIPNIEFRQHKNLQPRKSFPDDEPTSYSPRSRLPDRVDFRGLIPAVR